MTASAVATEGTIPPETLSFGTVLTLNLYFVPMTNSFALRSIASVYLKLWTPQLPSLVTDSRIALACFTLSSDFCADCAVATESSNAHGWNQTSTEIIFLNKERPVIMSYGPNGREQLGKEVQTAENSTASLVSDWIQEDEGLHRINDPYNEDNVYADADLKERLADGIPASSKR